MHINAIVCDYLAHGVKKLRESVTISRSISDYFDVQRNKAALLCSTLGHFGSKNTLWGNEKFDKVVMMVRRMHANTSEISLAA
jgi:hypothetical protein